MVGHKNSGPTGPSGGVGRRVRRRRIQASRLAPFGAKGGEVLSEALVSFEEGHFADASEIDAGAASGSGVPVALCRPSLAARGKPAPVIKWWAGCA
jgi:hypothetical protein